MGVCPQVILLLAESDPWMHMLYNQKSCWQLHRVTLVYSTAGVPFLLKLSSVDFRNICTMLSNTGNSNVFGRDSCHRCALPVSTVEADEIGSFLLPV